MVAGNIYIMNTVLCKYIFYDKIHNTICNKKFSQLFKQCGKLSYKDFAPSHIAYNLKYKP